MQGREKMKSILLLAFGNPLLDMTIVVKDTSLHKRFNLPTDGQLEVNKNQEALFDIAMKRKDVQYTAGGCSLNTSRVFSWVLNEHDRVLFVGGIGRDEIATKLMAIIKESGVITRLVEVSDLPSGSCVALVLGAQRCLSANIGAAAVCRPEHVLEMPSYQLVPPMDTIPVIYLEGYFLTHSFDTALQVAQYCKKHGKIFIFNLCGSYVCEIHANELTEILPYVDVLFGYIEEYKTLQKFVDIPKLCKNFSSDSDNIVHDIHQIFKCLAGKEEIIRKTKTKACKFNMKVNSEAYQTANCQTDQNLRENHTYKNDIQLPKVSLPQPDTNGTSDTNYTQVKYWKELKGRKLTVVTQGPSPLLYATEKKVYEQLVAPIHPSLIVDTTGAGDSFVGGFLAAAAVGKSLETCLECGVWAAQQLLQQKGCTIPKIPATFL